MGNNVVTKLTGRVLLRTQIILPAHTPSRICEALRSKSACTEVTGHTFVICQELFKVMLDSYIWEIYTNNHKNFDFFYLNPQTNFYQH